MKTLAKIILTLLAFGVLVGVGLTGFYFASTYLSHTDTARIANCPRTYTSYRVILQHDTATPSHINAHQCDTLTIINDDPEARLVAFGPHEHHQPYDGVTERLLTTGQQLTVTLRQIGTFQFHDHLHDEVQGSFTVTPRP